MPTRRIGQLAGRHSRRAITVHATQKHAVVVGWPDSVPAPGRFSRSAWLPFSSAPAAHADIEDVIVDPVISALSGAVDPLTAVDPSAVADLALPAADAAAVPAPEPSTRLCGEFRYVRLSAVVRPLARLDQQLVGYDRRHRSQYVLAGLGW